jgi:hypothetical protein
MKEIQGGKGLKLRYLKAKTGWCWTRFEAVPGQVLEGVVW